MKILTVGLIAIAIVIVGLFTVSRCDSNNITKKSAAALTREQQIVVIVNNYRTAHHKRAMSSTLRHEFLTRFLGYNPPAPPPPPPAPAPVPPAPAPPPPVTTPTQTVVGVPYTCTGPVNNLLVRGTGSNAIALVNLKSGCTGNISFDITVTSGGGDGVKVQGGVHDLNIGPSKIVCQPGVSGSFHQDGVQVQGGNNVTFHNLTVICPYVYGQGAAGFYIDGKDFGGISNVVCDGCNLEHYHYGAMFTGPAPGSGVRNSKIHQGLLTKGYYAFPGGTAGSVNTNNTLVPACNGAELPC